MVRPPSKYFVVHTLLLASVETTFVLPAKHRLNDYSDPWREGTGSFTSVGLNHFAL